MSCFLIYITYMYKYHVNTSICFIEFYKIGYVILI